MWCASRAKERTGSSACAKCPCRAVNNSIVAGNTSPATPTDASGTYTGANNVIGTNALLAPLASYGGTTQTRLPLPGSLAIDAGNNATCPATDQRGVTRPQGAACDVGAVESQGFTAGTLSGNNQSAAINTQFGSAVGLTVSDPNSEPVAGR